jgi:hypothetical protein
MRKMSYPAALVAAWGFSVLTFAQTSFSQTSFAQTSFAQTSFSQTSFSQTSVAQDEAGKDWPNRAIRLNVPFPAGGGTDLLSPDIVRASGAKVD